MLLSGGFFGFFSHTGLLAALNEAGIRPNRIVGVSAGAVAGGLYAAGHSCEDMTQGLSEMRREDFWDFAWFLGGLLSGAKLENFLREKLPVESLEDCPISFAAIAFDLRKQRTTILERGPLAKAIRASASMPLLFRPVRHEGMWLTDGGVADNCGLSAIAPEENALLHILAPTMPWSRLIDRNLQLPKRPNFRSLLVPNPPKVTPFRLENGIKALEHTLEHTRRWLAEHSIEF